MTGIPVHVHRDYFPDDCPDTDWIQEVTRRGWTIITKDNAIRRTSLELQALRKAKAAAFFLPGGKATADQMAQSVIKAYHRVCQLLQSHTRPLIGTIHVTGSVTVQEGMRRGAVRR